MLFQVIRHISWQTIRARIEVGLPREDLVQLEEDAGSRLVVGEVVVFHAGPPGADVDIAHLVRGGRQLEVAVVDVLACSCFLAVSFVGWKKRGISQIGNK